MKKRIAALFTAAFTVLGLSIQHPAMAAAPQRYTPNITILHHEPIIVGDLRGSLSQSTDNEDLKKVFLLNAYLLNPQGEGYVIHFQTDDTINYDLKLSAFKRAVQSFTLLGQKKKST